MDDPNNKGGQDTNFDNNIHWRHFFIAESMPICQGCLCGWFEYNAISSTACTVLKGIFAHPEDFDKTTKEICWECVAIWVLILADLLINCFKKTILSASAASNAGGCSSCYHDWLVLLLPRLLGTMTPTVRIQITSSTSHLGITNWHLLSISWLIPQQKLLVQWHALLDLATPEPSPR